MCNVTVMLMRRVVVLHLLLFSYSLTHELQLSIDIASLFLYSFSMLALHKRVMTEVCVCVSDFKLYASSMCELYSFLVAGA